jgi:uncharacterized SAM-binding protein YcdF (DUF218 family)
MSASLEDARISGKSRTRRWGIVVLICVVIVCVGLLNWGGYLLESSNPLPAYAEAAIVLEGSWTGEHARLTGAMQLLRQGIAGRVLVPLPHTSYWGEPVRPAARHFLETNFGHDLADRVDFCEVDTDVDSTLQEATAIGACIEEHQWKSVIVVTSNYHTRRAGMIWRRVVRSGHPSLQMWVNGVADPEFQADGWWRKRLWAKTWLLELTKLIYEGMGGR